VTDPYYRSFDQRFPDYWRFKEWEREFDEYVKKGNLPSLELLWVNHDHFGSFGSAIDGVNTVEAEMADNDYAIGMILEKIAHSPFAKDTLVFVIEDDAQNGPDHVDAHRSLALVAGPYVKQGAVVSRRYNTVSMLRTIEEVLGMKPMGLNDAVQAPMSEVFTQESGAWSYQARIPNVLRSTQLPLPPQASAGLKAPSEGAFHNAQYWEAQTQGLDFMEHDKIDTVRFNLVLWNGMMGPDHPYPSERSGKDLSRNRKTLLRHQASDEGSEGR
jgi:DNA-binding beta-propeller fold protein YncE